MREPVGQSCAGTQNMLPIVLARNVLYLTRALPHTVSFEAELMAERVRASALAGRSDELAAELARRQWQERLLSARCADFVVGGVVEGHN